MALLASALMNHTTHLGLRSHIGPNGDNLSWRLPSKEKSKRRCDLSLRSQAERMSSELGQEHLMPSERMSSELGHEHLMPWEIPRRHWFHHGFVFGAATAAYQVLFLAWMMYMSLLIGRKIALSFT